MAVTDFIKGLVGNTAKAVGTAYDYLTPGLGSNRVTDYGNSLLSTPKPTTSPYKPPTTTTSYDPSGKIAEANKQLQASQAALAAIQAQIASQPKIQAYNTTAAYANAQKAAQGKVDPVYTDKLNAYLQQSALQREQTTRKEQQQEQDIASTLGQTNEDIAKNKQRTTEDQTTSLGDVGTNEGNFQRDSGTAFDRARAALIGNQGQTGVDMFGIGQGAQKAAVDDRNTAENDQTDTFNRQRRDINTQAFRTFDDLATSGARASTAATTNTARSKQDLQDFIDNQNLDEQNFRVSNESERQSALYNETQNQYKVGAQQFIASLVGKAGVRDQDILATQQFLGL